VTVVTGVTRVHDERMGLQAVLQFTSRSHHGQLSPIADTTLRVR
jgi:hypothetical protein